MFDGGDLRESGVIPRRTVPGRLMNTSVGRVHVTRYMDSLTLDLAHAAQADYNAHSARFGGEATPIVMIADRPFPLPNLELRTYWREIAVESGFEALALIVTGAVGMVSLAAVHLGGLLVELSGIHFRSFNQGADAARWLVETTCCEVDEYELAEVIDELTAAGEEPVCP